MAYDPTDPTQQNTTNTAATTTGSSTPTSGQTAGAASTTPPGTPSSSTPGTSSSTSTPGANSQYNQERQQKGTGFTNIQQILNANQGYGASMGQAVGQGLQNQATNVNNAVTSGQNTFNTAATNNYNTANSAVSAASAYEQQPGESSTDYANRLASANGVSQVGTNLSNAQYTGPTGLNNAGQIQSQAATASALGQLAGSSAGQNQLLSNMVANRGNYTQGDSALDSLLLGQGGEQYVQQGAQGLSNISNNANAAIASAGNQAANYTNAINTGKQNTTAALQNNLSGDGSSASNGVTGFTTLAQQQGTDYNNNATELGQLLQGKNSDGTALDYSNLTGQQVALLSNLSQYGLGNTNIYQQTADANNAALTTNALNNLGANVNETQGGSYYQGNQSQAAQNLASILGQSDIKNNIANNQFNTNVFDPTDALSGLAGEQTTDQATQQAYQNQANLGLNIQDYLNQVQQMTAANPGYANGQYTNESGITQAANPGQGTNPLLQYQANEAQTLASALGQPLATGGSDQQYAGDVGGLLAQLANNPNYQYYTGNTIDTGNDDTGSNVIANPMDLTNPNDWQNSSYFQNMANNAVGTNDPLQQYVNSLIQKQASPSTTALHDA